jgi:6-phosphogluconolactonase
MKNTTGSPALASHVVVYRSRHDLETAAAAEILRVITTTLEEGAHCCIALAGGSTPRSVYRLIGTGEGAARIEWDRVHLYFGDERMVPPTDAESNYRMVHEELVSRIGIPAGNVHRIRGEEEPADAAMLYRTELTAIFSGTGATFDLTLLGLGEDGHTASLFPGTDVLSDLTHSASAVFVPRLDAWRTTLTLPAINRSREILFLVSGSAKAAVVRRLLTLAGPEVELPASLISPDHGTLHWMLDDDAAALLEPGR